MMKKSEQRFKEGRFTAKDVQAQKELLEALEKGKSEVYPQMLKEMLNKITELSKEVT
jgi:hypothetical protein